MLLIDYMLFCLFCVLCDSVFYMFLDDLKRVFIVGGGGRGVCKKASFKARVSSQIILRQK